MTDYLVTWRIDMEADSPREAAELALAVQRRPESIATVFEVRPVLPLDALTILGAPELIDLDEECA